MLNLRDQLVSTLAKMPSYTGTAIRRANLKPDRLALYTNKGATVDEPSFFSATFNSDQDVFESRPHRMVIQSKNGKKINWASSFKSQDEVLFPPTQYIVRDVKYLDNGHIEILLDEVGDG